METSKPYDNGSRRLITISAQELLNWLVPGAQFTGQIAEKFQSVEIEADSMIEMVCNGGREIVQIEFQSGPDPDMEQRLLEYYLLGYRRYRCSIRSFVIYLRKNGKPPRPPLTRRYTNGEKFLWFRYKAIELCNMPHRKWLDQDCKGLFPLVPLMRGGARRKVIEEIITRLQPTDDIIDKELLTLTSLFASLAFSRSEDKEWSRRRFAMLKDIFEGTPMHEYYKELTRAQSLEEAREEVRREMQKQQQEMQKQQQEMQKQQQEMQKQQRKLLLMIVQAHFPTLARLAKAQIRQINNIDNLVEVTGKVGTARTVEEAQDALLSWQQPDNTTE